MRVAQGAILYKSLGGYREEDQVFLYAAPGYNNARRTQRDKKTPSLDGSDQRMHWPQWRKPAYWNRKGGNPLTASLIIHNTMRYNGPMKDESNKESAIWDRNSAGFQGAYDPVILECHCYCEASGNEDERKGSPKCSEAPCRNSVKPKRCKRISVLQLESWRPLCLCSSQAT